MQNFNLVIVEMLVIPKNQLFPNLLLPKTSVQLYAVLVHKYVVLVSTCFHPSKCRS